MTGQLLFEKKDHEASFEQPTIHFTTTIQLGQEIDLRKAVRSLLDADIAVSAAWPSEDRIRVTPKVRKLARSITQVERMREDLEEARSNPSLKSYVRFAQRHPKVILHGLLRRRQSESKASAENGDDAAGDPLDFAREVVLNAQKISAVERKMDARLFGGNSRDFDEFVRLSLRGSYHDIQLPGKDATTYVVLEPRLLLHRSGVAQLTIAVPIKQEVSTEQLVSLARSDSMRVVKSRVPAPLVAHPGLGTWTKEFDTGTPLIERADDSGQTFDEILFEHIEVVRRAIHGRKGGQWTTYATVIASSGSCCKSGVEWKNSHQRDVAQIAARHFGSRKLNIERLRGEDLSLDYDEYLSVNLASALKISFAKGERHPFSELNTVILVEHVLLQYCRLQSIEARVGRPRQFGHKLSRLQREAIAIFTDMRQQELRYGTAREIASRLLEELGGHEIRRTTETALALAAQSDATHQASIQSRRAMRVTWIATILAALVAIPSLAQLISLVVETHDTPGSGWFVQTFRWLDGLHGWGPWVIVLTVIALFALAWLAKKVWFGWRFFIIFVRVVLSRRGSSVPPELTLQAEIFDEDSDPKSTTS